MGERIPVAVLGATGAVGQRVVALLADHPWLRAGLLGASDRSAGKRYRDAVSWILPGDPPPEAADMVVQDVSARAGFTLAVSALDASIAGEVEQAWARVGALVSSNARSHRMADDVPLVVPEVNADHLGLLDRQRAERDFPAGGGIVTNPNCSTIGLVMALAPLEAAFGVEEVVVTTLQAASGAGYPGVPSLDLLGNVIPFIEGEEEKIETESLKILGRLRDGRVEPASLRVSALVNRVPVVDGHVASVSLRTRRKASPAEAVEVLESFRAEPQERRLPSAPARPIEVLTAPQRPQPRRDAERGSGMTVTIGRVRPCPVLGLKMTVLSHNTIRGAAGAALLNLELLISRSGRVP